MKFILNKKYNPIGNNLLEIITSFNTQGIDFVIGKRNSIKLFEIQNQIINIKSFKNPNIFNKIVYHYIRKSKANRSAFLFSLGNTIKQQITICRNIKQPSSSASDS